MPDPMTPDTPPMPDTEGVRTDAVERATEWHRITFDSPVGYHSAFRELMSVPATCSCGDSFKEAMYAFGHAYSANAFLEEQLAQRLEAAERLLRECLDAGDHVAYTLEACKGHLLKHPRHPGEPPTTDTINARVTAWSNRSRDGRRALAEPEGTTAKNASGAALGTERAETRRVASQEPTP